MKDRFSRPKSTTRSSFVDNISRRLIWYDSLTSIIIHLSWTISLSCKNERMNVGGVLAFV